MKGMNNIDKSVRWGDYYRMGEFNVMEKGVKLGSRVRIHHHIVLEEDVIIGSDCEVLPFTHLRARTVIGNGCKIDSHVISSGDNTVGEHCKIRYNSVLCRGIKIGNYVFISPNVMTIYLDHEQNQGNQIVIGDNVFIGTGAIINAGVTIGEGAIIGAMSLILRDVDPGEKVMGVVKPWQIIRGQFTEPIIVHAEDGLIPDPGPGVLEILKTPEEVIIHDEEALEGAPEEEL